MALHNLLNNLAVLASLEYQERYVIGGTAEEYVVIDDLFEDFFGSVEWANHPANIGKIMPSHLTTINQLHSFLLDAYDEAVAVESHSEVGPLMRDRPIWAEIRKKAAETLSVLGISFADVPVEELDEHDWDYPPSAED